MMIKNIFKFFLGGFLFFANFSYAFASEVQTNDLVKNAEMKRDRDLAERVSSEKTWGWTYTALGAAATAYGASQLGKKKTDCSASLGCRETIDTSAMLTGSLLITGGIIGLWAGISKISHASILESSKAGGDRTNAPASDLKIGILPMDQGLTALFDWRF